MDVEYLSLGGISSGLKDGRGCLEVKGGGVGP